ncbi:hypothetical protein RHGRI_029726 [Rhododendron griersonianum]|uniref:Uncharacterized protein n=1 Tax=Rhododendron griersonianum TaxID=479676 RepID=A0AAV6IMN8_9ERIC|nr:hypothetical protein RHGRI_029726 [Rhododendron griersonianum]
MGICKRPLVQLLWVVMVFIFAFGQCHGSRSTNVMFNVNPRSQNSGQFLGFLPRSIPIPVSGPSRKHNDIGLKSWKSP